MATSFIELVGEVETQLLNKRIRDKVKSWVNWSQKRICRAYPWTFLEIEATTPTTATKPNYYRLPDDFADVLSVRLKMASGETFSLAGLPIQHEDTFSPDQSNSSNQQSSTNDPARFVITGRTLLLRPSALNTTGTILLRYLRSPAEMVLDLDQADVPDLFREVIIDGAVAIGSRWLWDDKGDQDRADQRFRQGIQEMIVYEKSQNAYQENMGLDFDYVRMVRESGTV